MYYNVLNLLKYEILVPKHNKKSMHVKIQIYTKITLECTNFK